jgi:hypothetical protein
MISTFLRGVRRLIFSQKVLISGTGLGLGKDKKASLGGWILASEMALCREAAIAEGLRIFVVTTAILFPRTTRRIRVRFLSATC